MQPFLALGVVAMLAAVVSAGDARQLQSETSTVTEAAASLGDLDIGPLRGVLGRMPSPAEVDQNGWTDLHYAAALNLPELVEALLLGGADAAARLKDDGKPLSGELQQSLRRLDLFSRFVRRGYTPLHVAAFNNARQAATRLIAAGAGIRAKDSTGRTPLHAAAYGNAEEVATLLITHGANPRAEDENGATPLHDAALGSAVEVASLLIGRGADIRAEDNGGRTPLHWAARENGLAMMT